MNTTEIMNTVSRSFHKVGFQLKKHSPEILLTAGIIGTVTSAVMACKASTKVNDILAEAKETIDAIHAVAENPDNAEKYTEEDTNKALLVTYKDTGVELAKLYGPSILLGVSSIGCILASHGVIRKRNIALSAAYATIDTSFKEYIKRVKDRFGEDVEREIRYNVKAMEIDEKVVDENGNETTVTKTVNAVDPNTAYSAYARCFDETCLGWERDAEYNFTFLMQQQNYANDLLKAKGFLFLNDVYEMLGFQKTQAGQIVGWVYDELNPIGDNYVDFGIFNLKDREKRLFVNGYEKSIWLDFNVDGNILDLMP